jgi:hypothetical protein
MPQPGVYWFVWLRGWVGTTNDVARASTHENPFRFVPEQELQLFSKASVVPD